ncbi:hypothetical protein ACLB1Q_29315 [Escherichia coli]
MALGGWQISRLTVPSTHYASKGGLAWAVPAGALNRGSWSPSPLTIWKQRIADTLFMKGLTVFARPQKIPAITGMHARFTARCDLSP